MGVEPLGMPRTIGILPQPCCSLVVSQGQVDYPGTNQLAQIQNQLRQVRYRINWSIVLSSHLGLTYRYKMQVSFAQVQYECLGDKLKLSVLQNEVG